MKCNSYNTDYMTARCMATKEMEICSCGGDKSKCNFYDMKNKENLNEKEAVNETTFVNFINMRHRLCKKFDKYVNCAGCPISEIKEKYSDPNKSVTCSEFIMSCPITTLTALLNYNKKHPENPTWKEWLNYVYVHYPEFLNDRPYEEWLDTEINEDLAKLYNIPTKEQLKL